MTWTRAAQQITVTIVKEGELSRVQVTGPLGAWGAALSLQNENNFVESIADQVKTQLRIVLGTDVDEWPGM
jgi:hypothetical protein